MYTHIQDILQTPVNQKKDACFEQKNKKKHTSKDDVRELGKTQFQRIYQISCRGLRQLFDWGNYPTVTRG